MYEKVSNRTPQSISKNVLMRVQEYEEKSFSWYNALKECLCYSTTRAGKQCFLLRLTLPSGQQDFDLDHTRKNTNLNELRKGWAAITKKFHRRNRHTGKTFHSYKGGLQIILGDWRISLMRKSWQTGQKDPVYLERRRSYKHIKVP